MLQESMQAFMGTVLDKDKLKLITTIYHVIRLLIESSKIFVVFLYLQWYGCHVRLFMMQ